MALSLLILCFNAPLFLLQSKWFNLFIHWLKPVAIQQKRAFHIVHGLNRGLYDIDPYTLKLKSKLYDFEEYPARKNL